MTDEELEKLIKGYRQELVDLDKKRKERSEELSSLTEDELVETLTKEYEETFNHAKNSGVTIGVIPNENKDK